MTTSTSHSVAEAALATYREALPDKVKPLGSQWTVLAAVVLEDHDLGGGSGGGDGDGDGAPPLFRTIALATGSKCAGRGAVAAAAEKGVSRDKLG